MIPRSLSKLTFAVAFIGATSCFAADHFVSPTGGNVAPFTSWDTAATNIQDAIDAASAGETVWVTNGVYAGGGKVMAIDLTNRVVLDKALTVQSVNGPFVTTIQGAWDPSSIIGPLGVRCAWLTNNATLKGFTLFSGATRSSGSGDNLLSGGGVWCAGTNAVIANCIIRSNAARSLGGGAFRGYLQNCLIIGNRVFSGSGAGACSNAILINCTVVSNSGPPTVSAVLTATLTNCVIFGNSGANYSSSTLSYCCTTPLPAGPGNISLDPQLLGDGFHLGTTSPCRNAGIGPGIGTDLDGQPWGVPPSMGCDEWYPLPLPLGAPALQITNYPVGFSFTTSVAGQEPFAYSWTRNGTTLQDDGHYFFSNTTNLVARGLRPDDGGNYQVVVSNAFGMATSAPVQLVVHCVDSASSNPIGPYLDWSTAATSIQDAIDASSVGEFVLVTNGMYATGGHVMGGDLTNRVALSKPIIVVSVNGAASTIIQGAWDPMTNGPLAVRCVWLTNGATLNGFTIQGGGTRSTGDQFQLQSGGGVWAVSSTNGLVVNCVLRTNASSYSGGGSYFGSFRNCWFLGNFSQWGGGAQQSKLTNCVVRGNSATASGGGASGGNLSNCTLSGNYAVSSGGGLYGIPSTSAQNCIIYDNSWNQFHEIMGAFSDWSGGLMMYNCCTQPSPPGPGNLTSSPQLVIDGIHIAATSPCRGAGNPLYATGSDIDGEAWLNPPSIGCDEYYASDFTGPLVPGPITAVNGITDGPVLRNASAVVTTSLIGNADRVAWSFGDGTLITNLFYLGLTHRWTNAGDFNVTFTAYNADNAGGVSTNALIHVNLPDAPLLSAVPSNGTNLVLTFPIQAGLTYIVEQTTNLAPPAVWQSVASLYSYGGTAFVTNNAATNAGAFFRVRVP